MYIGFASDRADTQVLDYVPETSEVKDTTLNGKYTNAYMAVKDSDGQLIGSKSAVKKGAEVNLDTMQLITCNTNEKNTKAYEYSWHDENGKVLGSILIKGPCAQAVEAPGTEPPAP